MRRTMLFCTVLFQLSLVIAAPPGTFQNKEEDSWKKFERKGGRTEKAQLIHLQDYELSSQDIAQGRDLKLYDQGGHFNCFNHIPVSTRKEEAEIERRAAANVAAARQFIWKHWKERRRAYIRLSFDSVDANSTAHIFIEPGVDEKWQVAWRSVQSREQITTLPVLQSVTWDYSESKHGELVFRDSDSDIWRRL